MHTINTRVFNVVTGAHLAVILCFAIQAGVSSCRRRPPEMVIPVEFVVDVTPLVTGGGEEPAALPEPDPAVTPEPVGIPEPAPEPEPKPRPRREIEVSRRRVVRETGAPAPKPTPLTEAEIRKLLEEGARPGDTTSIPDEDQRMLALIKQVLDTLWQKPSRAAAGDAEAHLRLWIERDGTVARTELSRRSGNAELDASVQEVGRQARRLHGLSPAFIERRSPVTVGFKVE